MDYKFTFEDGSEAYLAHYGVKGRSGRRKSRVTKPEDEEKKRRRAKKLQNIQKSLTASATGSSAKKAKARVKAHFAKKKRGSGGRKDLSGRGILIEDTEGGKTKTSYY